MKIKIIIVLLIIMNIVLFFRLSSYRMKAENVKTGEYSHYKYPYKQSLSLNGKKIQDCKIVDLKSIKSNLNDVIENKKGLILLYDKVSCNICIDSLIININNLCSTKENNLAIIAVAYSASQEYLRRFARINKMKFPIYLDEGECLIKKLEIEIFPTVIVFNTNSEIINSFSLNQENKELNILFFRSLSHFLKN